MGVRNNEESRMSSAQLVSFIGGGNMARSLVAGLIDAGTPAHHIEVVEPQAALRDALQQQYGVKVAADVAAASLCSDSWVLAVKPQVMAMVCTDLAKRMDRPQLVISIAAGITCATLQGWLGSDAQLVRAMPNTPALLGAGMSGLYADNRVDQLQRAQAERILGAAGKVRWVHDEGLMDVVTAVSGSGPAYIFAVAEAMQAAAISNGLDSDSAHQLVVQTIIGAGRMLAESGQSPGQLRQAVTSPNGTTQAALEVFSTGGLDALFAAAIAAATERGRQLAKSG